MEFEEVGFEAAALSEIPDFAPAEFGDFGESFAPANSIAVEPEVTEAFQGSVPEVTVPGIYFVRVPRPFVNDKKVKDLLAQLQPVTSKLKENNAILSSKRDNLRELRLQLDEAMALKQGSQPAYDEKNKVLQELRSSREQHNKTLVQLKDSVKGFMCKTEEELDAKIKSLEERIAHEVLEMREEKMIVMQISKLRQQRPLVRNFETQRNYLESLEQENKQILRATMGEMDGQYSLIKEERDHANLVVRELYDLVKAAKSDVKALSDENDGLGQKKQELQAALDAAREESGLAGSPFKENCVFSLRVRDLVAAGEVEEARALCAEQTTALIQSLATNAEFRTEYQKQSALLRKSPISEVMPESGGNGDSASSRRSVPAGRKDPRAGGDRPAPASRAAPIPQPQGREKAKLLMEQLRALAKEEVLNKGGWEAKEESEAANNFLEDEDYTRADVKAVVVDEQHKQMQSERLATTKRAKLLAAQVAKLQTVSVAEDAQEEFELPTIFQPKEEKKPTKAELAAKEKEKEKEKEEQRRIALEAEERRKEQVAAKEKKRKEQELKRKLEESRKKAEEEALKQQQRLAQEQNEAEQKAATAAAASAAVPEALQQQDKPEAGEAPARVHRPNLRGKAKVGKPAVLPVAKSQVQVAARKAPKNDSLAKKLKRYLKQNASLVAAGVVIVLILLLIIYSLV